MGVFTQLVGWVELVTWIEAWVECRRCIETRSVSKLTQLFSLSLGFVGFDTFLLNPALNPTYFSNTEQG